MQGTITPLTLRPDRGQGGAVVRAVLVGKGAAAITRLDLLGGGLSVRLEPGADLDTLAMTITVAADARLGWRDAYLYRRGEVERASDVFEVLARGSAGWSGLRGIGAHLI